MLRSPIPRIASRMATIHAAPLAILRPILAVSLVTWRQPHLPRPDTVVGDQPLIPTAQRVENDSGAIEQGNECPGNQSVQQREIDALERKLVDCPQGACHGAALGGNMNIGEISEQDV